MLSGMAAGCVSASVIYPLDVVRLRLTTTPGVYKGLLDGLKTIVQREGAQALFKGLFIQGELRAVVRSATRK